MQDAEKLQVLLKHWIEHNASHGEEFKKWAQRANEAGLGEVSGEISAAAGRLHEATGCLCKALTYLRPEP